MRVLFLSFLLPNPYQPLLIGSLRRLGVDVREGKLDPATMGRALRTVRPDVLHLHNIHPGLGGRKWIGRRRLLQLAFWVILARAARVRVVWTVHELSMKLSRNPLRDRVASRIVGSLAHGIIIHCESARAALAAVAGDSAGRKAVVMPHGHFLDTYPNAITRDEARRRLGLGEREFVFLAIGDIRRYKGVPELMDAFGPLASKETRLLIAGAFLHDRTEQEVREKAAASERILLIAERVADDDVQLYMNAADVVAIPYLDILTSSAVILAMTFGKPCIVPRIGCMPDVVDERGAFLYDAKDASGLAGALRRALECEGELAAMGAHNRELVSRWTWEDVAAATLTVYGGRQPRLAADEGVPASR